MSNYSLNSTDGYAFEHRLREVRWTVYYTDKEGKKHVDSTILESFRLKVPEVFREFKGEEVSINKIVPPTMLTKTQLIDLKTAKRNSYGLPTKSKAF